MDHIHKFTKSGDLDQNPCLVILYAASRAMMMGGVRQPLGASHLSVRQPRPGVLPQRVRGVLVRHCGLAACSSARARLLRLKRFFLVAPSAPSTLTAPRAWTVCALSIAKRIWPAILIDSKFSTKLHKHRIIPDILRLKRKISFEPPCLHTQVYSSFLPLQT